MIYVAIFVILIIFSYIAILLLYPVNPLEMALVFDKDSLPNDRMNIIGNTKRIQQNVPERIRLT